MDRTEAAPAANRMRAPSMLVLIGGVVGLASIFLSWFEFSGQGIGTQPLKGTDLAMGIGTGVFAALLVLFGIIMLARGRGRGLAITSIVFAALVVIIGIYAAFAPEAAITSFESSSVGDQIGVSKVQAEALLEQGFDSGILAAKSQIGSYLALAGGALGLVASILATRAGKKAAA